jgi:hypothetical protein
MNSSLANIGWRVVHNGLESLLFDMGDMHRPSPNISKVMESKRANRWGETVISSKSENLRSFSSRFVPLKQLWINIKVFFVDLYDDKTGHKGEMMFWENQLLNFIKFPKSLRKLLWCVTSKAVMTGDGSHKKLPWRVNEKATLMCHYKGYDDEWQDTEKVTLMCQWKGNPNVSLQRLRW